MLQFSSIYSFFFSWVSKTQPNHWTKRMANTRLATQDPRTCPVYPPKNGVIALWPNTRVVKCKYYVSQKQNGCNNQIHWYSILLTFIFKFKASLFMD